MLCYKFRGLIIGQNCGTVYTNEGGHRDAFSSEWCETLHVLRGLLSRSKVRGDVYSLSYICIAWW